MSRTLNPHTTTTSFADPVLTYSNTNKYIIGTLNMGQPLHRGKGRKTGSFLRVKSQIQFSLIDAMLMGLKLSPGSTNKYITGTLNKGENGGKRVVFLGCNKGGEGIGKGLG